MTDVIVECDLSELFGPVRDQGLRPTCMAFAASDIHAAVRPNWVPLSCEYAYFHALQRDGGHPDEGTTPDAMLTSIQVDGQPPESQWCYLESVPRDASKWKPPHTAGPMYRRGSKRDSVSSVVDLLNRLDAGVPVLLTMCLSDAFFNPDDDGLIVVSEPPDPQRRHAVIAVGHGKHGTERMILIRNSWGQSWGIDGYAWLSETYLLPRIDVIAEMKEDLTNVSSNPAKRNVRVGMAGSSGGR